MQCSANRKGSLQERQCSMWVVWEHCLLVCKDKLVSKRTTRSFQPLWICCSRILAVTPAPEEIGGDDLPAASWFLLNHYILKCMDAICSTITRCELAESKEKVQSFFGSNVELGLPKPSSIHRKPTWKASTTTKSTLV